MSKFIDKWWEADLRTRRPRPAKEAKKLNNEVPFLGIAEDETRDSTGQLIIRLNRGNKKLWIVIGKYAEPRGNDQFYVTYKAHSFNASGLTTYHEELLMAVTRAVQLKEEFENANI